MCNKALAFITFYICSTFSFCQSFTLKACHNNALIPFAHIQNTTTGHSTISNESGEFKISAADDDVILITHISFQTLTFFGSDLSTICLQERTEFLDEVIVETNRSHKFLMEVLEKTKNKLLLPARINAYYKDFIKRDKEYTHFGDADITYYIEQKRGNIKIDVGLYGSRAYMLPLSPSDDDYIDLDLISPIGCKKIIEMYDPKNIERFLSEDAHQNYDYEILSSGNDIIVMAKPIAEGEGVFEGEILINAKDSTLSSVKFSIPEYRKEKSKEINAIVARIKILENQGYFIYSRTNEDKIYPSFLRMTYDIKIWNNKKVNQVSSFISDLNIYEISDDPSEISKSNQFNKRSIYNLDTNYKSEYWKSKSLLGLTEEEIKIIENASKWASDN